MGGGHHHWETPIPDYKAIKWNTVPELVQLQERLAAKGLKDHWARNDVWKYDPAWGHKNWKTFWQILLKGFKPGVAVGIVTGILHRAKLHYFPAPHVTWRGNPHGDPNFGHHGDEHGHH